MGSASLQDLFRDLFALSRHQHKTVAEMWTHQRWDLVLGKLLNDWEIPRLIELYKYLESFQEPESEVEWTVYGEWT